MNQEARVIVALDFDDAAKAMALVDKLDPAHRCIAVAGFTSTDKEKRSRLLEDLMHNNCTTHGEDFKSM